MKSILSFFLALGVILTIPLAPFAPSAASAAANSTTIYSDTNVMVYGPLDAYAPPGSSAWGASVQAVLTQKVNAWPLITASPAAWISNTYITEGNITGDTWRRFTRTVTLCKGAYDITGMINATADNAEEVYVNGVFVGSDGEIQGPFVDNFEWSTIQSYPYQIAAANTVTFDIIVRNYAVAPESTKNPTGLIYSISLSYKCPTTATSTSTATSTPTDTPTNTPTNTPTITATSMPTNTATSTPTFTSTPPSSCTPNNDLLFYSDTSVMVYGPLDAYAPPGNSAWGNPASAVLTQKVGFWPTMDPAAWISNTYITEGNITGDTWRRFTRTVVLPKAAIDIAGTINATADNAEAVFVNGVLVGSDGEVEGPFVDNLEWSTIKAYPFQMATANTVTFDFIVRYYAVPPDSSKNPTGLIFNLSISYNCPTTATYTHTSTPTSTNTATNTPTSTPTYTPTSVSFEGCTPGYWKQPQHLDSWNATWYLPSQTLESVFNVPDMYGLDNYTLLQALSFQGGSDTVAAARNLMRAAVPALLNSASPDVDYTLTTPQVISQVNAALASNDRSTILTLAEKLDQYNNQGCPLN
jgi:hypothetical protein